jgi:hypothetical protein
LIFSIGVCAMAPSSTRKAKKPRRMETYCASVAAEARFVQEVDVELGERQAVLAALAALAGTRKGNAGFALADLLSRRGLERPCETLVAWARLRRKREPAPPAL